MRASVLLPTRSGPSMAMKRGGWTPRCGTSARLAAEESLPGIVGGARSNRRNARDYSRVALTKLRAASHNVTQLYSLCRTLCRFGALNGRVLPDKMLLRADTALPQM